jgi:ATP-binding cassette subfamily B multidrug efflux pump
VRILKRLLPFYTPYRSQVLIGLGAVLASSALYAAIPALLQRAVDAMRDGRPARTVWSFAGAMVVVALIMGVFRFLMRYLMNGVSRRIEADLRYALFTQLTKLDAAWYARARIGEVLARLTNDVSAVRMAAGPALMYLTNTAFGSVFSIALMVSIEPRLAALAMLPMVLLPLAMSSLGRRIHDRFEAVQAQFGAVTTMVQEHLAGVRVVRAYRQEPSEQRRFEAMSGEYQTLNMRLAALNGTMNAVLGLLAGLGAVIVLGVGGGLVLRGAITIGAFLAFALYLTNLTWPLIALGWVVNLFQRGAASMGRLTEILDARPAITDSPSARSLPPTAGGRTIEFRNVAYAYPTADGTPGRVVLHDVSFTLRAGETIGVVGATGSGKSTLLELIPRLRDPDSGEVLMDGIPLRQISLASLRAEIGYVPQEALVFSETIGANLAYGTSDETAHLWAARLADLDETIAGFREGYATMLGERGINLSGGEKQRATIARALARRPSVVLLDDALSAVDTHTEARILSALRDALSGRTAIIASHRASALRDTSWILVLDDGRIVEQGRHGELLEKRGRYWQLVRRQQLEEDLEEPQSAA